MTVQTHTCNYIVSDCVQQCITYRMHPAGRGLVQLQQQIEVSLSYRSRSRSRSVTAAGPGLAQLPRDTMVVTVMAGQTRPGGSRVESDVQNKHTKYTGPYY